MKCVECNDKYIVNEINTCTYDTVYFEPLTDKFLTKESSVFINFNMEIKQIDISKVSAAITLEDSGFSVSLTITNHTITGANIIIGLTSNESIQSGTLRIEFANPSSVRCKNKSHCELNPSKRTVEVDKTSINFPKLSTAQKAVAVGTTVVITIATILSSLVSINYAIILIKIYQMLDFMLLYNIRYPPNFQHFISLFKTTNPLKLLPDIFSYIYDDSCAELGDKLIDQDMGCQFFSNCGESLILIMFVFVCYYIMRIVNYIIIRIKKSMNTKLNKMMRFVTVTRITFIMIQSFDLDILISAFINIKFYAGDRNLTFNNIFNHLLSHTLVWFYPLCIFHYFQLTEIATYSDEEEEEEYLRSNRNTDTWYQKYREIVGMGRNYLICMFIAFFYDRPYAQITSVSLLLAVTAILEVRYAVFDNKLDNIIARLIWFSYTMLSLMFLITKIVGDLVTLKQRNMMLGLPMIILFGCITMINLSPLIISSIISLCSLLKKMSTILYNTGNKGKKEQENKAELEIESRPIDTIQRNGMNVPKNRTMNRNRRRVQNQQMSSIK